MEQNISLNKNSILGRRNILGGFIAAHGIMHALLLSTPRPDGGVGNFITRGGDVPVVNTLGLDAAGAEILGTVLVLATAVALVVSALLYLRNGRSWRKALILSSVVSVATMVLYWNDWMVMAPLIDAGLVAYAWRAAPNTEG